MLLHFFIGVQGVYTSPDIRFLFLGGGKCVINVTELIMLYNSNILIMKLRVKDLLQAHINYVLSSKLTKNEFLDISDSKHEK